MELENEKQQQKQQLNTSEKNLDELHTNICCTTAQTFFWCEFWFSGHQKLILLFEEQSL